MVVEPPQVIELNETASKGLFDFTVMFIDIRNLNQYTCMAFAYWNFKPC